MKRWAWLIVLAATAAPGCVTTDAPIEKPPERSTSFKEDVPPPPQPVLPDQVTDSNAKEMALRLQAEIDRDRDGLPVGSAEEKRDADSLDVGRLAADV